MQQYVGQLNWFLWKCVGNRIFFSIVDADDCVRMQNGSEGGEQYIRWEGWWWLRQESPGRYEQVQGVHLTDGGKRGKCEEFRSKRCQTWTILTSSNSWGDFSTWSPRWRACDTCGQEDFCGRTDLQIEEVVGKFTTILSRFSKVMYDKNYWY